ncbi:unnamed protein product [Owenia fusiformis]|uniref:BLOC-1-related complex subunit 5 n=1 Tax=Owenia fusiformis TaxID=6347 RepID=A0A8S4NFE0_OWEFU|nr:unnamed protein product [Owenia fusiformis]
MGAEQSNSSAAPLKSQRDEDIPYTSYSISKPINNDSPKASPRLKDKAKSSHHRDKETNKDSHLKNNTLVVVAKGNQGNTQIDPELLKLDAIPVFLPLMRGSLNIPNMRDPEVLDKLDYRQVLEMCLRYQEHLRQSSEAVAFDQNALCVRIKEIDYITHSLMTSIVERQKKFAKYAEQIQKIGEINIVLNKVKMNVEQTTALMERLNNVLPPEDKLEPFSMKPA